MTKSIIDRETRIELAEAGSEVSTDFCVLIPLGNDPEEPFCGEASNEEFALEVWALDGVDEYDVFVTHEEIDGMFLDVTVTVTGTDLVVAQLTYSEDSMNDGSDLTAFEQEVAYALGKFYGMYD